MRSRRIKIFFISLFLMIISIGGTLLTRSIIRSNSKNDLINISELSKEFMDNYFEEMKKVEIDNKENMLIVTSKKKIENDFGATNIIEGPNNQYFILFDSKSEKERALVNLKKNSDIISVEKNNVYKFTETDSNKTYNSWGIKKSGFDYINSIIDVDNLEEVNVAIIDTGCNMSVFNKYFNGKIVEGYNVYDGTNKMFDNYGHGTHIAGTIAEATPSNVKIIPFKVSDGQNLYDSDIILSINYIVDNKVADVINMSFGSTIYNEAVDIAIEAAKEQNIISVAAAGNDGNSSSDYPALNDNTISISAVDSDMNLADFSNYGDGLNFSAPGVDIKSIASNVDNEIMSGTSMATPHAVSAVAILKSLNKDLSLEGVVDLLKTHSVDLGPKGYDKYFGEGFINLSSVQICENSTEQSCDEYGVFREISPNKIEVTETVLTDYNYGSITNILASVLTIHSEDGNKETKPLYDIDNLEIVGYDPFNSEEQEVKIKYLDYETIFKVKNPTNYQLGWEYERDYSKPNSIILTKYKDNLKKIKKLYFPVSLNGMTIISIANSYDINSRLFNNSIDKENIEEVYLPRNITSVGINAFVGLDKLYKFTSEADSLYVGATAFRDLPYLTYFNANTSLDEDSYGAFSGSDLLEKITLSDNTTLIPSNSFMYCSSLKNIELSNNIKLIDSYAFMGSGLESITIPESVTNIKEYSLYDTKLKSITIPSSVLNIGESALGNPELESITVSPNNKKYDSRNNSNAIIETESNKLLFGSINTIIPNSVSTIGSFAFMNSGIVNLNIPEGVTTIEQNAFSSTAYLEEVYLPRSLINIPSGTFDAGYNSKYLSTVLMVYDNSYSYNFAINENRAYKVIDREYDNDWVYDFSVISFYSYEFDAFEQVDKSRIMIENYYNNFNDIEVVADEDYWIEYQTAEDGFRYGDYYYYIYYNLSNGIKNLRYPMYVTVNKPVPSYEIPTGLTACLGQLLEEIPLPEHFEWMNGKEMITELGEQTFKARYEIDDNYQIVEDIDIVIDVVGKSIVEPTIKINNKIYDGTLNVDINDIVIENLDEDEYTITEVNLTDANVGLKTANVKIKLSNDKFKYYAFLGEVQEKEFSVNLNIIPKTIKKPTLANKTYTYNGEEQIVEIDNFDEDIMQVEDNKRINAGEQNVIISLKNSNYIWEDNTTNDVILVFKINKAELEIEYESSSNTVKYDGNFHSIDVSINSPTNAIIKYMDSNSNYVLDEKPQYKEVGEYVIKFRIYVDDNHTDIYGEETLKILNKNIINNSKDYEGFYDGKYHSIKINLDIDNYEIKYSLDNNNYNLENSPKFISVGEYTVYYKIMSNNYEDYYGSNKVKIYDIKSFDNTLRIKDNVLISKNNSFSNITSKVNVYAKSILFNHLGNNGLIINSDSVKTGDILKIILNNSINYNYQISLLGDVNADGKITSADYVKIRKHIMQTESINNNIYFYSADINNDNNINSKDYVKIRKYIMNGESL